MSRSARWRVRPFTLPKHAFGDQGPCWACMTDLRRTLAHAGCFAPLQKVSTNPYFNHTTSPPRFAFSALCDQGRAERARLAFGWRRCPSRRTLAVSAPLQKVSANPYFDSTSSPPTYFTPQQALSGAVLGLVRVAPPTPRGQSGQAMAESRGGRAPKYPTNPVAVLETHAPRAGRVWGAARCASRGQG